MSNLHDHTIPPAAVAALNRGNTIEAIRIVREENGLGLKEAKDAVDAYIRSTPGLRQALGAQSRRGQHMLLVAIVVVAAIAAVVWSLVAAR